MVDEIQVGAGPPAEEDKLMTKQIVAFFASSFLCVALTIPACAEEKSGVIAAVDRDRSLLIFADGTAYRLPGSFDYDAVSPGMEAHVIVEPAEVARG
ncbi:hypothetical protein ASG43_03815 [Aureimonas sp. Leaf454]|nr:hypothetical protein ASG43_03815 [Aureimonas sp. Leaf454]